MIDLVATFIIFFAVIDPIGTVPVFIAVTRGFDARDKRKIALIAALVASAVLVFFVVAGELILTAMAIPLAAFQISGGIVLFLFALSMIFGESKPEEELKLVASTQDQAVFPLAVPSIASPGAMLAATAAAILAQPIGMAIQERYTTDPNPGNLEIKNISLKPAANLIVHRIDTVQ